MRAVLENTLVLALFVLVNASVGQAQPLARGLETNSSRVAAADSQGTDAGAFAGVEKKLKPGQNAIVTLKDGHAVEGRVISLSPSWIDLRRADGGSDRIEAADVQTLKRTGPIWDGAVKGALIATIPAMVQGAGDCYDCKAHDAVTAYAIFGPICAGMGLLIDAMVGPKTVYKTPSARRVAVTIIPPGLSERRGLLATIRF